MQETGVIPGSPAEGDQEKEGAAGAGSERPGVLDPAEPTVPAEKNNPVSVLPTSPQWQYGLDDPDTEADEPEVPPKGQAEIGGPEGHLPELGKRKW